MAVWEGEAPSPFLPVRELLLGGKALAVEVLHCLGLWVFVARVLYGMIVPNG